MVTCACMQRRMREGESFEEPVPEWAPYTPPASECPRHADSNAEESCSEQDGHLLVWYCSEDADHTQNSTVLQQCDHHHAAFSVGTCLPC